MSEERDREEGRQEDEERKRAPDDDSQNPITEPHKPAVPGGPIQEKAHENDPTEQGPDE